MNESYKHYKGLKFARPAPRILEIIFHPPERLNALDDVQHAELASVWRDIDADPDISCVLLRGEGKHLAAGAEMSVVEGIISDWNVRLTIWKEARDIVYNIINCSKPVVSAIEGVAVGAGLAAAMMADVVIAGRNARIIDGHTKLGVAAGDHSVIIWPLLCGMAKAKYYLLTCERLTGEEAERIGLVSLVAEDGKAREAALEACHKLVAMPPAAVRWTKYALNNWLRMAGPSFDASLALEFMGFTGPEVAEGLKAIKEKREPAFDPECPL